MSIRQFLNTGLDFSQKLHIHHGEQEHDGLRGSSSSHVFSYRGEAYLPRASEENACVSKGIGAARPAQTDPYWVWDTVLFTLPFHIS